MRRWQRTADCKEPLNVYEDISCCWIRIGWILERMRSLTVERRRWSGDDSEQLVVKNTNRSEETRSTAGNHFQPLTACLYPLIDYIYSNVNIGHLYLFDPFKHQFQLKRRCEVRLSLMVLTVFNFVVLVRNVTFYFMCQYLTLIVLIFTKVKQIYVC